jgi:hypothetical protein
MRNELLLIPLILVIFLSGCTTQTTTTVSSVGLSRALSSDVTQAKASMPITFILTVKNLVSEDTNDISAELLNLTGWQVENSLQHIDKVLPNDMYKFTWIAYAPSNPNNTFLPVANVFYRMESNAKLNLRVYDNNYLNTLKSDERGKIQGGSALLSSTISKNTPVTVKISIQQPFILTENSQRFPFVIEIKNAGSGKVYRDNAVYPPAESFVDYFRFSFSSNSTITCDYDSQELVKLDNGIKTIACRLSVTQDDVNKYADFPVDFTISYMYLDKASAKIQVV